MKPEPPPHSPRSPGHGPVEPPGGWIQVPGETPEQPQPHRTPPASTDRPDPARRAFPPQPPRVAQPQPPTIPLPPTAPTPPLFSPNSPPASPTGGPPVGPPFGHPTAPPVAPAPAPEPRPVRRPRPALLWQILCGVMAIALIGLVIVTATNSDNGSQWRQRATTAESLSTQLGAKLKASESSTGALRTRIVTLAAAKAKAEDNSAVTSVNVQFATSLAAALDSCTSQLNTVFEELSAAQSSQQVQSIAANDAQRAFATCDAAATAASGFSQYLGSAK